jgi:hypothetical protein
MTSIRIIRYSTTPQTVEANERAVTAVYDELHSRQPADLGYGTLLVPEENRFFHILVSEADSAPLPQLEAFREFVSGLPDRLSGPVMSRDAVRVGGYRLL